MFQNIIDVLTRPDTFFQERIKSPEDLKIPFLLVAITGIIASIYGYEVGSLTSRMFAAAGAGIVEVVTISSVIGAFIGVIIFWLIGSAVFYLISLAFKGRGNFNRTLEVIGYGFIPQIFGGIITLIMAMYYIPMIQIPVVRSISDPTILQTAVTRLMHDQAMLELTRVSAVISIIFLLWSASIWMFGIRYARDLSLKNAVLTVFIPVVIYIIYTLFITFVGFPGFGGH